MNALSSERYYNENGDMGVLVSLNKYSFASDDLEMATDKRVIDIFRRFCSKDKDNHILWLPILASFPIWLIKKRRSK